MRALLARFDRARSPERREASMSVEQFAKRVGLTPALTRHLHAFLRTQAASDPALRVIRPLTATSLLETRGTALDRSLADALRSLRPGDARTCLPVHGTPTDVPRPFGVDILVASSPRAGNTIVRRLLTRTGCSDRAVVDAGDLEWSRLPSPVAVQAHLPPSPSTTALIERHGVRVVTAVRHPVDTLLSAVAFAEREPETSYWPGGRPGPDPRTTGDVDGFRRWATSESAAALLAVSTDWVLHGGATVVRYEELVAHPQPTLDRLTTTLGLPSLADAAIAMAAETAGLPPAHLTHVGPGARHALDARTYADIVAAHRRTFQVLGYE